MEVVRAVTREMGGQALHPVSPLYLHQTPHNSSLLSQKQPLPLSPLSPIQTHHPQPHQPPELTPCLKMLWLLSSCYLVFPVAWEIKSQLFPRVEPTVSEERVASSPSARSCLPGEPAGEKETRIQPTDAGLSHI